LLGGRAAEEVIFDQISTGALSDLERTTKMAQAMVTIYGLNDKLGNISYYDSSGQQSFVMDKPYSDDTAKIIDDEISKLIEGQYERAVKILTENKSKLDALAEKLLEKEVIFRDDLVAIFGERPFDKKNGDDAKVISEEMRNNLETKVPDIPNVADIPSPGADNPQPEVKPEEPKVESDNSAPADVPSPPAPPTPPEPPTSEPPTGGNE